jgi:bacillopeptidase F (M6 metalloprotease family)
MQMLWHVGHDDIGAEEQRGFQAQRRKARQAVPAIVREAKLQATDLILMANVPMRVNGNAQPVDPAIDYVMKNALCEALVLSPGHPHANGNERKR